MIFTPIDIIWYKSQEIAMREVIAICKHESDVKCHWFNIALKFSSVRQVGNSSEFDWIPCLVLHFMDN